MSALLRTTVRAGLVGGLAVLAAAGTASTAQAESRDLQYSCGWSFSQGDQVVDDGTVTTTARYDSAIPDGLVVIAGEDVDNRPFTGSVVFPAEIIDLFRGEDVEEVSGAGTLATGIEEIYGAGDETDFLVATTAVPTSGSLTVSLSDVEVGGVPSRLGTNTFVPGDYLQIGVGNLQAGFFLDLDCDLVDEGDIAIDRFLGTAAPTATAEPSTTASAVRPGLVQTDAPVDEGTSGLPAALLGAGALTAAALGWGLRRTGTSRRH